MQTVNIFWFRRDLRLDDNAGLFHALKSGMPVVPVFIFDRQILDKLEDKADRRVEFIHLTLSQIQYTLSGAGSSLEVYTGTPVEVFTRLANKYAIGKVFTNHDYEPYARERDSQVADLLNTKGISLHTYKDHVILEKDEVLKEDGKPYTVFTPFSKKWRSVFSTDQLKPFLSEALMGNFHVQPAVEIPSLSSLGFEVSGIPFPSKKPDLAIVKNYTANRNFPAISGTSKMGLHLRFGTISIRSLAASSISLNDTFTNELIWRDFYHMILWHFPKVGKGFSFKPMYENIEWRIDGGEFEKWCLGQTGYPIVDAGMRELNATGFIHNRVRMIVASFLCKHLLLDWRLGEAYFAAKLLDFDMAANNGGWQWASGSGCDAAPYFRIFNPRLQTEKFDPDHTYIKKWVPEYSDFSYPKPIVDHEKARKRCLEVYSKALKNNGIPSIP